jgi:3-oxoacyl-[acyl-carrier protein] reductase
VERFGSLDVLVNNAGTARWRSVDEVPDEDWRAAWEVNVMAPLRAMRAAIPGMRERGWGRVVNVASTAGKRPSALMPEYSVAKAAELSLSRLFADLYARDGVLVNAVCPGPTKSELWMESGGLLDQSKEAAGHETREQALDAAGEKRPIGRLAEVSEIADAIVFLCSERASYVAGAAWSVDGGTVQVII